MTGLIGWWPLHENSGNKAYDLSGNGNHGSLNGGVTQGVAGKGGLTSYSFDGTDDYINAPVETTEVGDFTACGFVRYSDLTQPSSNLASPLIRSTGSDEYQWAIFGGDGEVRGYLHPEDVKAANIGYAADENRWYHVAIRREGTRFSLFIDGAEVDYVDNSDVDNSFAASGLTVGEPANTGEKYLEGSVSDVRIYDRALTPSEIQTLYEWGSGDYARPVNNENSSSAVSRYKLDGDANDSWASNDGTVNGGLSWTDDAIRGRAASFDGSEDYIEVSDNSSLDNSNTTYSFWMNTRGFRGSGTWNMMVDKHGAPFVGIKSGEVLSARVKVGGTSYNFDGPSISTNNWYHVALTYNGSEAILYLNGNNAVSNSSMSGDLDANSDNLHIGTFFNKSSKYFFDGLIDDVRIYDKALRPEEIFDLYRYGTRGRDLRKFTVNSRGL